MRDLPALAEFVHRVTGIHLKPAQFGALRAALGRAAPGLAPGEFLARAGEPDLVDRLLDEVTVKETSFLRDRRQLEAIDWRALLETARAAGSGEIRAWSAGCATGEEPYTLALLAREAFAPLEPPLSILATDISRAALAAATEGRYRPRAVRELDADLLGRYLAEVGGEYAVDARLRVNVEFRRHNLIADPVPPLGAGPFDLIVCRNVIIYFDAATVERLIASLEGALSVGGVLVLGAADGLCSFTSRRGPSAPIERLRHPLARPSPPREKVIATALEAASGGRAKEATERAADLLAEDPLDADAYFLRGLGQLESGQSEQAVVSLRRALYVDPRFGLAAFTLGRAHDAVGDLAAARRAYEQALRTLEPADERHQVLLQQVDLGDVAAACRWRLAALSTKVGS